MRITDHVSVGLPGSGLTAVLVEELVDLRDCKSVSYVHLLDQQHLARRLARVVRVHLVLESNLKNTVSTNIYEKGPNCIIVSLCVAQQ